MDFYAQGATSSNGSPLTVPAGSSTIPVYDPGEIQPGSTVQAGLAGPTLSVTAVTSSSLTVGNAGSSFSLPLRTRLILVTGRPTIYLDPLGTVPAPNSPALIADATGRVTGYIDRTRFDYVVAGNSSTSVTVDSASSATITGGNNATWQHTAAGDYRVALVAVSWTGVLGTEAISSVTYAGIPMTPLGSASNVNLFYLPNPPAGTQTVVVAFEASDVVHGVAGALTAKGVDLNASSGLTNSGSGTSATLSFPASATTSRLFGVVGIGNQSTQVTVSPGSGQANHWNSSAGSSPFITNGMGSSKAGLTSATSLTFSWGPSRAWGVTGVELRYLGGTPAARLHFDAQGGLINRSRLNARDFVSIQAAIDALPAVGGVVHVPAGTYTITATIFIPKNNAVHLIGDGADRTVIHCTNKNADALWIKGSFSTIEDLTIQGAGDVVPDPPNEHLKGRGVVIGMLQADDPDREMRRVSILGCRITDTPSYGLYVYGQDDPQAVLSKTLLLLGYFERTDFVGNKIGGMIYLGSVSNGHYFVSCLIDRFSGIGLNAFNASALSLIDCDFEDKKDVPPPGVEIPYLALDKRRNVLVSGCWFENHQVGDVAQRFIVIGISEGGACEDVTIQSCRFVRNEGALPLLLLVAKGSKSISILNPTCTVTTTVTEPRPAGSEDILIPEETALSEVVAVGGVVTSGSTQAKSALYASSSRALTIVGIGPRVTPPRITSAERDATNSLARDKKPGDLIYNSDLGRLQTWTGADWVPVRKTASGTASQSGALLAAAGAYHVSAYVTLSSSASGSVSVTVSWMEELVQRNVTVVPTFSSAGGATSGVAYIVAAGAVTYNVTATGFTLGSYSAEIRAEAV